MATEFDAHRDSFQGGFCIGKGKEKKVNLIAGIMETFQPRRE